MHGRSNDSSWIKYKWFACRRHLNMIGEAFGTRKRFLGVPTVSCAGWVGTIKHSNVQWLKKRKKKGQKRRGTQAILKREN